MGTEKDRDDPEEEKDEGLLDVQLAREMCEAVAAWAERLGFTPPDCAFDVTP